MAAAAAAAAAAVTASGFSIRVAWGCGASAAGLAITTPVSQPSMPRRQSVARRRPPANRPPRVHSRRPDTASRPREMCAHRAMCTPTGASRVCAPTTAGRASAPDPGASERRQPTPASNHRGNGTPRPHATAPRHATRLDAELGLLARRVAAVVEVTEPRETAVRRVRMAPRRSANCQIMPRVEGRRRTHQNANVSFGTSGWRHPTAARKLLTYALRRTHQNAKSDASSSAARDAAPSGSTRGPSSAASPPSSL